MKTIEGGLAVAFDGPDGVGKSTQIKETAAYLSDLGYDVHTTSFSGGTPIGTLLRGVSLSETERVPETDVYISLAMGIDLAADLHKRRLMGQICLIDRSPLTVIAYNVRGSELRDESLGFDAMNKIIDAWPLDQVIYLNADQAILDKRRQARTGKALDYYESKGPEYHQRVRAGYDEALQYAKDHTNLQISEINAGGSVEEIQEHIRNVLVIDER